MSYSARLALPFWLIVALFGASFSPSRCEGGVAAIVNNDVVTFSDVRDLVGAREREMRSTLRGEELLAKVKALRLSATEGLVDRLLILQAFRSARQKGPGIDPEMVDARIEAIVRDRFGGDRDAFMRNLAAQPITIERFRAKEEENLIVDMMRKEHQPDDGWIEKLRKKAFIKIFGPEVID